MPGYNVEVASSTFGRTRIQCSPCRPSGLVGNLAYPLVSAELASSIHLSIVLPSDVAESVKT